MRSFGSNSLPRTALFLTVIALGYACSKAEPPVCGNGVVEAGEQCDSSNRDQCTDTCTKASCGDGVLQKGEECDDGNGIDFDECTTKCRKARCGDGVMQSGEECDDGNVDDHDTCTNKCKIATCGDGIVRPAVEACDDGAMNSDTGNCTKKCALPSCGDGKQQPAEQCDDGNLSNTDDCLDTCIKPSCGDGFVHKEKEECDDANFSNNDACTNTCKLAVCGDGFVRSGLEECDLGMKNDDTGACTSKCTKAKCGDGVVQKGVEECDDANFDDADDCLSICVKAKCGDGLLRSKPSDMADLEECDDGNTFGGDFCGAACKKECILGTDANYLLNGHCYMYFAGKLAWGDAQNDCLLVGAHLVSIGSKAENDALKVNNVKTDSWTGLTDQYGEGAFIWDQGPGSKLAMTFKNFAAGEPDNQPNNKGNCVFYGAVGTQWSDFTCDTAMSYVCEYDYAKK